MSSDSGGCGKLIVVGIALVIGLPLLVNIGMGAVVCGQVAKRAPNQTVERSCADEVGSPCAAAQAAFEAARNADTEALRGKLVDPSWLEKLPPAATSTPAERGQFYLRMLLGEQPGSLEELRGAPLTVRAVVAKTELDGKRASVGLEVIGVETRKLIVQMRIGEGGWRLVPLER